MIKEEIYNALDGDLSSLEIFSLRTCVISATPVLQILIKNICTNHFPQKRLNIKTQGIKTLASCFVAFDISSRQILFSY